MKEADNGEGMTITPLGNGSSNLKENTTKLANLKKNVGSFLPLNAF
jgi:hypothetical protein